MKKYQKLKIKVSLIVFSLVTAHLLLFTGVAFAASGAEYGEWKDLIWPGINFAILVFILVKFGRKPIKEFVKNRTELIEKSLKE